jgi:nitroreductase
MIQYVDKIIELASMAPSGHNTQPWIFQLQGHYIRLVPDFSRKLSIADPDNHSLFISLGCALENLVIAAAEFGYNNNIMYDFSGTHPSVLIHLYEDEEVRKDKLFTAIERRHVSRVPYFDIGISYEVLHHLQAAASASGIKTVFITDEVRKKNVGRLTARACKQQFQNPAFKKELLEWVRFNNQQAARTNDGIRSASLGSPSVAPSIGRFFFQNFTSPHSEASKAADLIDESAAIVVFATSEHHPEGWMKLGRSFERFALTTTHLGIRHAHLNMACEEEEIRRELKSYLQLDEEPLLLIRIGYADEEPPVSYRRPIKEIITEGSF